MENLLKILVEPLVENPNDIDITAVDGNNATILQLRVHPDDMGRVIGKGGKRAQAIRSIMKAKGNSIGERILLDIVD